jgi:hypothetical protein
VDIIEYSWSEQWNSGILPIYNIRRCSDEEQKGQEDLASGSSSQHTLLPRRIFVTKSSNSKQTHLKKVEKLKKYSTLTYGHQPTEDTRGWVALQRRLLSSEASRNQIDKAKMYFKTL